jgi:hypothetical protein
MTEQQTLVTCSSGRNAATAGDQASADAFLKTPHAFRNMSWVRTIRISPIPQQPRHVAEEQSKRS